MMQINAHKLLRLLERTRPFVSEHAPEPVRGIRLDSDGHILHAVGTDRYTLAVARAEARHRHEAWATTIAQADIGWLTGWLSSLPGDTLLTLTAGTENGLTMATDRSTHHLRTSHGTYAAWRDIVRSALSNPLKALPVRVVSELLTRWQAAGPTLQMWATAPDRPLVIADEAGDFLGLQMPMRANSEEAERCAVTEQWQASLGNGPHDTLPTPPASHEATWEFASETLRRALRVEADVLHSPDAWALTIYTWSAYRYLNVLRQADPDLAERITAEVTEELEDGDLHDLLLDAAEDAGLDIDGPTNAVEKAPAAAVS